MIPSTSVSPAAIRNSMTPYCRPFSSCSKTSAKLIRSLHGTLRGVGVAVILQYDLIGLVAQPTAFLDDVTDVVILDGEVVVVEPERPAHRFEIRLLERSEKGRFVLDATVHCTDRAVE